MTSHEGAIQFRYRLTSPQSTDHADTDRFERMAAWRQILKQLKLIGRDARRYDGFGYGNLSVRDAAQSDRFYITASQTGGARRLRRHDVVRVDRCNLEAFEVAATGALPPSSESITHAMVYAADPAIAWIMHGHSPAIWLGATRLELPVTAADVAYGSPAMAAAVSSLLRRHTVRPLVFVTLGHEDGVFACGASANAAGTALLQTLADALAVDSR